MEKCTGCPWIGYIHLEHVVDELLKTFDEESQ